MSSDAVRAFGLLAGRVGPDRRTLDDVARVDGERVALDGRREAVHAARRGTAALLTGLVVLRAVAGALEPLRRETGRDSTAEVGARRAVEKHLARALAIPGRTTLGVLYPLAAQLAREPARWRPS